LNSAWYRWDNQGNNTLTTPFIVSPPNSTGAHTLLIGARDDWNMENYTTYNFYIIDFNSITSDQQPIPTQFGTGSFFYSLTFTNKEQIPLNLTLRVFGTNDDVITGNGSQFILRPRKKWVVELEIQPKHASIHKLEICLFYEDILFYHTILLFNVSPQWISPNFLLPSLISIVILMFGIMITGTSFLYAKSHSTIRKRYWKYHDKLMELITQLTISNLETAAAKENKSRDHSSRLIGFPQHLHQSDPLDREALNLQYQSLHEEIAKNDPENFQKLSKLITRAEELLNDTPKERESEIKVDPSQIG
jgi:hypothetical protein